MAKRPLRALQVEVTSRCTRRCTVCARTAYAGSWLEGDLDEALWRRLVPDLRLVAHLHLQGWGEPLLHPRLPAMVVEAQAAGCRVGLTTNGDLLPAAQEWILAAPPDLLAVSVAGGDDLNRRLRDGALTGDVLAAVAELAARRSSRRRPRLHLSYLLTRDGAADLEAVVGAAAAAGVDAVLVNHLDVVPSAALAELAAWGPDGVPPGVGEAFAAAAAAARRARLELRLPAAAPEERLVCDLDPRRILSVRWDGRVAPCVHLNLPIDGRIARWTADGPLELEPPVLGRLGEAGLADILAGDAYREFVAPFERRMAADAHYRQWGLLPSGWGVVGVADLDRAWAELERGLAASPFPRACGGCPKVVGW
jgi:MoaA/NifB/PqqE/SkfB family radical SAM enzyme